MRPELPKYWIGLLGGPVTPEVRHHVQIPENQGLLIREVVPDSPAAKAGIEKFDILLRANDAELHEMTDLIDLVRTLGEQKAQITLEVLRHGERDTVYITPEERPAHVALQGGNIGPGFEGGIPGLPGEFQQLLEQRGLAGGPEGQGFDFRHFGPGVVIGRGAVGVGEMPNGVTVNIQKNEGQPTKITVQRGEESWEVTGDDAESLKALPEDVRPFVERMLHGGGPANFSLDMPEMGNMPHRPAFDGERLRERLEAMERQLQEMQRADAAGTQVRRTAGSVELGDEVVQFWSQRCHGAVHRRAMGRPSRIRHPGGTLQRRAVREIARPGFFCCRHTPCAVAASPTNFARTF